MVALGLGHKACLLNVANGTVLRVLEVRHDDYDREVESLAFSPDKQTLAVGYEQGGIRRWRVADGERIGILDEHRERVRYLSFSSDGQFLASGASDGSVILWRMSDGEFLHLMDENAEVIGLAFSSDGKILAAGFEAGFARLWWE